MPKELVTKCIGPDVRVRASTCNYQQEPDRGGQESDRGGKYPISDICEEMHLLKAIYIYKYTYRYVLYIYKCMEIDENLENLLRIK